MPNQRRVGDLEIEHDLTYQRREWRAQRVGWACLTLVIVAALLGLAGRGPLSSRTATAADGSLQVEYDRFVHYHDPAALLLTVAGGVAEGGEVRVWVSLEYLATIDIQTVTPEPVRVEAGADGHVFVFRTVDPDRPTVVTVRFEPDGRGSLAGRVGVVGRPAAAFDQFAYP